MSRQEISNNIAAAARSPASSNNLQRHSSLFKRDSAVSLGQAGSRSDVRRLSVRRSFQSSEAAFIEDDLAEFLAEQPACDMGPVYRLVRWLFIILPLFPCPTESTTTMRVHHRAFLHT